jgi:xanthine phosphoribosyltransferase
MDTRRLFVLNSIHYDGTRKLDTLRISNIPDLSDAHRVLILDDIADSGETLVAILQRLRELYPELSFKIATLFHKPGSLVQPDFTVREATSWVDFFWEIDPLE